jgi:hypothetical protein
MVDVTSGIGDRRIGIGPGESKFNGGKQDAVDHHGGLVGAPDPGVPQIPSSLEGFNVKAVVKIGHLGPRSLLEPERTTFPQNQM